MTRSLVVPGSRVAANVLVFPNPATSVVHIKSAQTIHRRLRDLQGRILINSDNTSINISSLASGLYLLDMFDKNGRYVKTEKVNKLHSQ